jgi:hypothetical protein
VRLALRHARNIVVFRSAKATHFRGATGDYLRGATRRGHCHPARRRRADLLLREVGSGKQTAEIKHACDVRLGTRATTAKVRKVKWEACEAHRFECHERCRLSFIFRSAGLPHHARFDHLVRAGRGARACAPPNALWESPFPASVVNRRRIATCDQRPRWGRPTRARTRPTQRQATLRMGENNCLRGCLIRAPFSRVLGTLIKRRQFGTALPLR